jgi:DNA-directed RNA polymerase specialized sigma subunit
LIFFGIFLRPYITITDFFPVEGNMDILREAKAYMKQIGRADQRAAELRARAAEIEEEMAFPLSAGVSRMKPWRAKGQHKSSVEAMAIKREKQGARIEALEREAERVELERAYVVAFLEYLKRTRRGEEAKVLDCRYLRGWNVKQTAEAIRWSPSRVKQLEEGGLMSIGAVFLGLLEQGAVYDRQGLFVVSAAEAEKLLKKWQ